jgi:hypothetical protein
MRAAAATSAVALALLLGACGDATSDGGDRARSADVTTLRTTTTTATRDAADPIEVLAQRGGRAKATDVPAGGEAVIAEADIPKGTASAEASRKDLAADDHPSPGAPTDAEVRAEVDQFKAVREQYGLDKVDYSGDLIDPRTLGAGFHTSIASVFSDFGLPIACSRGTLGVHQLGVAHKTLPCGTMVTFRYGGRAIRVAVIDRGPYIAGREWDLTGATAAALKFPGLGPIDWKIG